MNNQGASDIWELLNLSQDFLKGKIKTHHDDVPQRQESVPDDLALVAGEVAECRKCGLAENRNMTVPGIGTRGMRVMVIGEGPGAEEDRQGEPFVGKAGQYLDKWLEALGLKRKENVFIGNIVKCRPPGNRDPHPDEVEACMPYLERQIAAVQPKVILAVGRIAAQNLLKTQEGIGRLRKRRFEVFGIPMIATYHPSAVLRNQDLRRPVWEDLQDLQKLIDELGP